MALNFTGIKVSMNGNNVPTGTTIPPFTQVEGDYITIPLDFGIPKAGVENATPSTTFNNLLGSLSSAIQAKLSNDFDDTAKTVDASAELFGVQSNLKGDANTSDMYKDVVPSYICSAVIYVKVS